MVSSINPLAHVAGVMLERAQADAAAISCEIEEVQAQITQIDHQSRLALKLEESAFDQSRLGAGALWQLHLGRRRLALASAVSSLRAQQEIHAAVVTDSFGKKTVLDQLVEREESRKKRKIETRQADDVRHLALIQRVIGENDDF